MTTTAARPAKVRTLTFDGLTRLLVIAAGDAREGYWLHDVPTDHADTMRVRFVKHSDGSKRTVTVLASGTKWCDCQAGHFGKPCRHVAAVTKLVSLGLITAPAE